MIDRKLAFVYSPEIEGMSYPPDCPFKTQRATLTRSKIVSFGMMGGPGREEIPGRRATLAELSWIHLPDYLAELQRAAAGDLTVEGFSMGLGWQETPVFKDMFEYGAWACGSGLVAAELLLAARADIAFNLHGGMHHAGVTHASGFCFLNDVALACHRLALAGRRVGYLDVDAHHGDGVQEIFYERPEVLTISMHESGKTLYPWSGFENEIGSGAGLGYNVNIPLPAGTYDEAYLSAFERVVVPLLGAYQPDVIVLELGMDALAGDPLTHLSLTNNAVVELLQRMMQLGHPMLIAGGGGYQVEHTVRGWTLAWRTCAGEDEEDLSSLGLGGVMLGSSEWAGGLRDLQLPISAEQRAGVASELEATVSRLKQAVFGFHGLGPAKQPTV